MLCPHLPPLLGGGESLEPGHLVAVARRGGWARARLLGECRLALPDWGLEEEVRDTRFLRELPSRWEGVPALALQLTCILEAGERGKADMVELGGQLEGSKLALRVVSVGEAGVRGHLLQPGTGHLVYKRLQDQGRVRVLWH